jgi:hypothetical protein
MAVDVGEASVWLQALVVSVFSEFAAKKRKIRATDAKEVGVENPAEETCCHPNQILS